MKRISPILSFLFLFSSSLFAQKQTVVKDQFLSDTYWMNSDYQLGMETFNNKILLVEFWHPLNLEGRSIAHRLEDFTAAHPQFQLVTIMPGDSTLPFSRNDLFHFVQENQLHHPVGIAKNLDSFKSVSQPKMPTVLMYEGNGVPVKMAMGTSGFDSLMVFLETKVLDPLYLKDFSLWQVMPAIDPAYWADPIIECPSYLSSDGPDLFITENAQNKIIVMDNNGNVANIIGSKRGFEDGIYYNAMFNCLGGTAMGSSGQLYIADTDNHRIRVAVADSGNVSTLAGNGKLPAFKKKGEWAEIGYPTDVIFSSGKLMVISGYSNELIEVDASSGKIKSRLELIKPRFKNGNRVYARNIAQGSESILVVFSDGSIVQVIKNKVKEIYSPISLKEAASSIAEKGGKLYVALPNMNAIAVLEDEKIKVIAGGMEGFIDEKGDKAAFRHPFDIAISKGDLVITDQNNDAIRIVSEISGNVSHVRPDPLAIISSFDEAPDRNEPVIIGPIIVGKGRNTVKVKFDLGEYTLVTDGRNDLNVIEEYGMDLVAESITKDGFTFSFMPIATNGFIQMGIFLTIERKGFPDQVLYKRAYLNINYEVIDGEENKQEVEFAPNLKPF